MKTVTSVSGGRTSSYMALHFPTDYNIFSLVRIEDKRCTPKDKKLIQYVEDKIKQPFIATAESDLTLYVLIQLEQDLGKEIIWVTGDTFEHVIYNTTHKNSLPNRRMRYCTSDMKMLPIFWWCYLNLFESKDDFISMNIGYRADEQRRNANDLFSFVSSCNINYDKEAFKLGNTIYVLAENLKGNNKWTKDFEWRESHFPLRDNNIYLPQIKKFFILHPEYIFPLFSNCVGCFNKTEPELQRQFTLEPHKMNWFKEQENKTGRTWNISGGLDSIEAKDYTNGQQYIFENVTCNCTD